MDRLAQRLKIKARLREIRENMPAQTSEEAYAGLEKRRVAAAAEKAARQPLDLPYITP